MDRQVKQLLALVLAVILAAVPRGGQARNPDSPRQFFVPVLVYHHVKPFKPSDDAIERGLTVPPAQFWSELRYLHVHGYHTVTGETLLNALSGQAKLPLKPVAITFDDGYTDQFFNVFRDLRAWKMKATFFIVPGFLGKPRYLTWGQVKAMSAGGMDIEAHTMTHPDLTVVPAAQQHHEIFTPRVVLQRYLHHAVRLFAYPYGAYNPAVLALVGHAGYRAAFTTHQGWVLRSNSLLTLPRVYVDNDDTMSIFAGRLTAQPATLAADPI